MKTITKEWLRRKGACSHGVKWFLSQNETSTAKVMLKLVDEGRNGDALWVLEQIMDKKQSVQLAIFSSRLCLENFEKKYPNDDRPRMAIEAAEAYLKRPCEKTESAAWAAWSAAESAAESAAGSAAWAAAKSAAWAAWSAARPAAGSAARSVAIKETSVQIIREAIRICEL